MRNENGRDSWTVGVVELFNIQANGRDLAELNSKGKVILNGNSFYT